MKKNRVKLFLVFSAFFLLDLIRPFGYSLSSEFLFLGIVFVALNFDLATSLVFAIIFGYFKDTFTFGLVGINVLEFAAFCIFIHFIREKLLLVVKRRFHKYVKFSVASIAIIAYSIVNFACTRVIVPYLFIQFFVQSLLLLFLIDYLLKKWIIVSPPQSL